MRPALLGLALALLVGAATGVHLARERPAEGRIDIAFERAHLVRLPDRFALEARAEVELPDPVRAGLDSGVPLEFVVALKVREPRRFWPDRRRVSARWRYRLEYYELTGHYRLGSPDTGESRNYRSLLAALEALGTLRGLTVGPVAALGDVSGGDLATLSMRLDTGALPLPLRPLLSSSWRVGSEPLAWRVAPDDAPGAPGS